MNKTGSLLLIFVLLLLLTACNFPTDKDPTATIDESALRTSVAETLLVEAGPSATQETIQDHTQDQQPPPPSDTPEPGQPPTDTVMPSATNTLAPTATFTFTPSPTDSTPMVSVSLDTNCRAGPGMSYDNIGALRVGERAKIAARAETGFYWIIENPDRAGT